VPPGEWAHYAVVFDGTNATLFIDAQRQGSFVAKGELAARRSSFTVARAANENARFFRGRLDEIAVYGKALAPETLARHVALARGP